MKSDRGRAVFSITAKAQNSILAGHPWVYDSEIKKISGAWQNGGLCDVLGPKENYLGTALVSEHSKIRLRLLSRNANDRFDEAFFLRRIRHAWEYRKTVLSPEDLSCCRIIFGEADFLPGLTVDRFGEYLVTQTLSIGMDMLKPVLFPLLLRVLREDGQKILAIYERNDVPLREREGLSQGKGFFGEPPQGLPTTTKICENGIYYNVDFENGQKTGYFLDQKYNRLALGHISAGKRVLDCFTHTGSFALNALKGGAAFVEAVDVSQQAVDMARENALLNGMQKNMEFTAANVFDLLPAYLESKRDAFDLIILDPPAFTKSRSTLQGATRGYKEINLRAMKLLPRGGYLATCSCSHFMTEALFCQMLRAAAADACVSLRQIEARRQSPDHPVLWNVPETDYLKFYLFQVV